MTAEETTWWMTDGRKIWMTSVSTAWCITAERTAWWMTAARKKMVDKICQYSMQDDSGDDNIMNESS